MPGGRGKAIGLLALLAVPGLASSPAPPTARRVDAREPAEVQAWDARLEAMVRADGLRVRRVRFDSLLPGRQHERLAQVHRGVPVFGGELVRQTDGPRPISIFGTLYEDIEVAPEPSLTADQAVAVVERLSGVDLGPGRPAELLVLPHDQGDATLVYRVRAATGGGLAAYFIDAHSGEVALRLNDLKTQSAVGLGTGVLNDTKKLSTRPLEGAFVADDQLRPPALLTFDLKGDLFKAIRFLNAVVGLGQADLARDQDNTWTDGAAVDAHAYAGWTYDYYFRRFGRRGLDNTDLPLLSLVHPVRREDLGRYSSDVVDLFYLNAFYAGDGIMVYGEGLPPGRSFRGQSVNFFSAGLDVVAHELTHGVTEFSSNLIYRGESGALNEAFSDIMATGVEFFFQLPGEGLLKADYLLGEDVFVPGGIRSLQHPARYGDPDHYSVRFTSRRCDASNDNCGVHINSSIPNHAFYLAVEGGTNRVSGLGVQGVGGANREQIEKAFYRAFTFMLPASADFALARAATVQSARDLYGAGSPAERAVSQAWTAVGVE